MLLTNDSFCAFKILKLTYALQTKKDNKLFALMILNVTNKEPKSVDVNKVVDTFSNMKLRRYSLK